MDIEERAEKWADEKLVEECADTYLVGVRPWLVDAYLAGSAQTQQDYVQHFVVGNGG